MPPTNFLKPGIKPRRKRLLAPVIQRIGWYPIGWIQANGEAPPVAAPVFASPDSGR
jgi:hypothetical protein